jgi:hypothetical protein
MAHRRQPITAGLKPPRYWAWSESDGNNSEQISIAGPTHATRSIHHRAMEQKRHSAKPAYTAAMRIRNRGDRGRRSHQWQCRREN